MIQIPEIPAPPPVIIQGATPPPWVTMEPGVIVIIALAFFGACAMVLYPLVRAIGRRIEGRSARTDPAVLAELGQLRSRVEEVEALQHRVMELEERVDFAERLLAQRREPERLERGPA